MEIAKLIWNLLVQASPVLSLLAVVFTWLTFNSSKPAIKIDFVKDNQATLMIPDRPDKQHPDIYWHQAKRLLMEVTISNKSSLPISITNISFNNKYNLTPYQDFDHNYSATTFRSADPVTDSELFKSISENPEGYVKVTSSLEIQGHLLKPVLDIGPYSAKRGFLIFRGNEDDLDSISEGHTYPLTLTTPRTEFEFPCTVTRTLRSVISSEASHPSGHPNAEPHKPE